MLIGMKSTTHFTLEVKNTGGWAQGTWDLYAVAYNLDHANKKALQLRQTYGNRNIRLSAVTTKRLRIGTKVVKKPVKKVGTPWKTGIWD
jgi:hypothetical protein